MSYPCGTACFARARVAYERFTRYQPRQEGRASYLAGPKVTHFDRVEWIIIPDAAKEKPIEGEVIAVGSGKFSDDGKQRPLDVKQGDRVLFGKYSGTEIKVDGVEHLILREAEILGIIEK